MKVCRAVLRQSGFSVVELMVAMLLSLFLLAGVLAVTASSKVTYAENERVARLQEAGRSAFELILRDVRGAGYRGCAQDVPFRNTLNNSNDVLWNFAQPVQGFDAIDDPALVPGGTWQPALSGGLAPNALRGNDVLVVRTVRARTQSYRVAMAMTNPTDAVIVFDDGQPFPSAGQALLISDCAGAAVFALTGSAPAAAVSGNPTRELSRDGVVAVGPGNATGDLGTVFSGNSSVTPLDTIVYYLAPSVAVPDSPALWRRTGAADPVELVSGVEGMQVLYGEDQNGDRLVDDYLEAGAVTDFRRVVAVTLALLIRSAEEDAANADTREYDLLGVAYGPFNDRFQRLQLTTTATLRNRTD